MSKPPVLTTDRLILRPFTMADADMVEQLAGDIRIAENTLNIPHPYTQDLARAWILTHEEEYHMGRSLIFAICKRMDDQLIGAIGLTLQQQYSIAELGYWIGVPFWNHGYCTEACRAVIDYALKTLKLNKITARCFSDNPASERVLLKLGMVWEGRLRKHYLHHGRYRDITLYGLLAEEWQGYSPDQKGQN